MSTVFAAVNLPQLGKTGVKRIAGGDNQQTCVSQFQMLAAALALLVAFSMASIVSNLVTLLCYG